MLTTTEPAKIQKDFGVFGEGNCYNMFGIFRKEGHIMTVYEMTNCGSYFIIQCDTSKCPGKGSGKGMCTHRPTTYTHKTKAPLINNLLGEGFCYQMVHDQDGRNTYFTSAGSKRAIL